VSTDTTHKSFPKAVEAVTLSLACVVIGGVWLGSHVSKTTRPSLGLPTILLIASGVLFLVGILMISRVPGFAWNSWVTVGKWTLLAYVIESGMILYAFVHNHVRGSTLGVVIGLTAMFAIDVPFLVATTVARYDTPGEE
jgi:hypothetical protein